MFARFDENPAVTLQDNKETNVTNGCTDGRTTEWPFRWLRAMCQKNIMGLRFKWLYFWDDKFFMRLHFYVANPKFSPQRTQTVTDFYFHYIRVTPLRIAL